MGVVARMVCNEVKLFPVTWPQGTARKDVGAMVNLTPVYGGNDGNENTEWAVYTPGGLLNLTINNPEAAKQFIPGREYMITINEV